MNGTTSLLLVDKNMLSPNSLLQQGRYRIIRDVWDAGSQSLYEARDTLSDQAVLVREINGRYISNPSDGESEVMALDTVNSISNRAILGSRDHFIDSGSRYIVSGPSSGQTIGEVAVDGWKPIDPVKVIRGLKIIVENLIQIAASDPTISTFHTDPASLLVSADGDLKYVYFGSRPNGVAAFPKARQKADLAFAFMPLEAIWDELDLVSQKAISHSYSQRSLEILESSPDFRTDIAVLASFAYLLTTGVMAPGALERSIEVLEGNPDPLVPPSNIDPAVPQSLSDVVVRAMSLKRQDRYDGFGEWLRELNTLEVDDHVDDESADIVEDADILEIPVITPAAPAAVLHPGSLDRNPATLGSDPLSNSQVQDGKTAIDSENQDPVLSPTLSENVISESESRFAGDRSEDADIFSTFTPPKPWFLSPAVLAALLIVVAGGVVAWYWVTSSGNKGTAAENDTGARSTVSSPASDVSEAPAQPVNVQAPDEVTPSTAEVPVSTETVVDRNVNPDAAPGKVRPLAPAPKSRLAAKPASDGAPGSKKKVTVDDLISDN